MSPCVHVTARSFALGGDTALNSKPIQAERPLAVCQLSMTLQRTQYWAASKRYSLLLPQNACGNWVGLLRPRQLHHPGKGVMALPLLLHAGSQPALVFNILLLNGTQMSLRNLMSRVLHRPFVIPTVGGQKPQIPKLSKGLGILLM